MIIFFAFISDFDVLLSKYAKDKNHRMLITHSIIPSLFFIILGYMMDWPALYLSGYSYSIHVLIDTLDWGTNFFYFQKKQIGPKFLISKEEFENISDYLSKYKNPASFFDEKYYNNKICMVIEVLIFFLMILSITILAFPYILLILLYFPFILFHLYRHFKLKKIESQ
ncbi:MAG: hypothetical protein ACFFAQ_03245 [Promethearchaeota archaeon]